VNCSAEEGVAGHGDIAAACARTEGWPLEAVLVMLLTSEQQEGE